MQPQNQNPRSASALNHPNAAEWMEFLYGEVAGERKRELSAHLAQCPECSRRTDFWRQSMAALDDWKLPTPEQTRPRWQPVSMFRWAAAAAVVLLAGFAIGRQTSSAASEIAALKNSVSQLAQKVEEAEANETVVTSLISQQVASLLSQYAKLNDEQRTQDRKTVALALREMEARVVKLRSELETVAVNTESGFRQTQEGLTQLASFTAPERNEGSQLTHPDSKTVNPN